MEKSDIMDRMLVRNSGTHFSGNMKDRDEYNGEDAGEK
jgi:hypothetical protein